EVGDELSAPRVCQRERQVPELTLHEDRWLELEMRGEGANGLREDGIGLQMRALGFEIPIEVRGFHGASDELRRAACREKVGQELIRAGLWQRQVNLPASIGLLLGMHVLEHLHVTADDEQVISLF